MVVNQAPARVRAVARVGAAAPERPGEPTFVARPRHDRIGAVSVVQLMLIELVLVIVVVATGRNPVVALAAIVVGVAVLLFAFGRSRGRWWTETMVLRWQCRHRVVRQPVRADDNRLAALRSLVPDLTVSLVEGAGGAAPVGVGRDGSGWFAVAAVLPKEGLAGDPQARLPLDGLARLLAESNQPGTVLQVLTHTLPAPATSVGLGQPCTESYRELMGQAGAPIPSDQVTWVSVRLDAELVAAAFDTGAPEEDLPAVTAALIRRIGKRLKRAGLRYQLLDTDGLLDALVRSCDLDRQDGPVVAREEWTAWHSVALSHACFWLRGWPALPQSGRLLTQLTGVPATMTSLAVILEPRSDGIDVRCLGRVAAPPALLQAALQQAKAVARRGGGHLLRLDGEQAPAVYATAPTGGGAR